MVASILKLTVAKSVPVNAPLFVNPVDFITVTEGVINAELKLLIVIVAAVTFVEIPEVSNLIKGETGVYMIRVDKVNNSSNSPNSFIPYQKQITSKSRSNLDFLIVESLKESADINDNRSAYY